MTDQLNLSPGHQVRRAKRYDTKAVDCELGSIRDLSDAGMRVECKGEECPIKPGQLGTITLNQSGQTVSVQAETRWVKRRGLFKHEAGLMFVNVSDDDRVKLQQLAQFSFLCEDDAYQRFAKGGIVQYEVKEPVKASFKLPDYYKILNVDVNATSDEINDSYQTLLGLYDPKKNQNEDTLSQYKMIKDAYNILSDPSLRETYNAMCQNE